MNRATCLDHLAGPDPLRCDTPGGYRVVCRDARGVLLFVALPYCGHHAQRAKDRAIRGHPGATAYYEMIPDDNEE